MQTFKKIGLGVLPAIVFSLLALFVAHKVLAAGGPINGESEWRQATYTMNQKSQIIVNLAGNDHDNIIFTDSNPNDANHTYTADTNGTGVCSGTITFNSGQTFNNNPIKATINVKYMNGSNGGLINPCPDGNDTYGPTGISIVNNTSNGGNTPADTGPTTITYNGDTYTQLGTATGVSRVYGLSKSLSSGSTCYGGAIIVLDQVDSAANAPVKGTVLPTQLNGTLELSSQVSNFPNIPLNITSSTRCRYNSTVTNGDNQIITVKADGTATFTGCSKGDTACKPSSPSGDPSGTTAPDNSCEANYTGAAHTLNWLFCSILEGVDSMFNTIYNTISSQLNICTGKSSTTGDTCSNNLLTPQVEKSWAVFRDLATALLVIIMLIMVFSQAISVGPFDAYTVRKILPRLVAMAILIQISWPMLKFLVDLSNDLGNGIQQIMLAPFGGASKLALDNQIGQVGVAAPSLTLIPTAIFTGAVLAFSGITIFGWLLIGVSAVISVLVGLLVILFRQMLIILAIMVAPLAFIAYVLPGTQQYWKIWKDNFTKLLLMFPLIMAMIAAGKIFASVGSNSGNFLGLVVVLIGFVGPLWFLPKTFKWGGQLFSAAASGAWNGSKRFRGAPGKYALSKAKENRHQNANDRYERLSYGRGKFGDRLIAAAGGLGLNKSATEVRTARNRAQGREEGEKEVTQAIVGSTYETQDHANKLDTLTTLAQGKKDTQTGLDGSNPAMQRWALDQLATFGDWDRIDALRTADAIDERTWQTFVAKNISAIHQNAPYLSPIRRDMSGLGYAEFGNWKDHSFHEYERQITNGLIRTADGQGWEFHSDPTAQRALAINNAKQALADPRIRANMSAEGISVLERISKMENPESTEVSVTPGRRQSDPAEVHLPTARMLQTNETARNNLTAAILPTEKNQQTQARQAAVLNNISYRLANPNLAADDPERKGLENYLAEFRNTAASTGNPDAVQAYNSLLQSIQTRLQNYPSEVQNRSTALGRTPEQILEDKQAAQDRAQAELDRMLGVTGVLKPIA